MIESVDYQAVLADLKARRARLDQLIAGLEGMVLGQADAVTLEVGTAPPTGGPVASGAGLAIHPDTFFGLALADAAKKYLKMVRRAQHTTAIADALAKGGLKRPPENNLSSILVRAAKGREVVKVGKGTWGLAEWYPRRPAETIDEPKKRGRRQARKGPGRRTEAKSLADSKPLALPASSGATATNGGRPPERAMEILRAAMKPVHIKDIIRTIESHSGTVKRPNLEAQLNRWVKAGKLKKTAPSTFAL